MSICAKCRGEIVWKMIDGRWRGLNPNGSDHWDACSKRRWKQVVATGKRFENKRNDKGEITSGYKDSVHGTKLDQIRAPKKVGRPRKILSGNCRGCVPPWDVCPNACPDAIEEKQA